MATNKEIVRQFVAEVFEKKNVGYTDQAVTGDFVCHDPLEGHTDTDGFKEQMNGIFTAFPDMKFEVCDVIGEGDLTAVRWRCTGTHEKALGDIPATGRRISMDGLSLARTENGKIAEEWDQYDALGMFRQLGVVKLEQAGAPAAARQAEAQQPQA